MLSLFFSMVINSCHSCTFLCTLAMVLLELVTSLCNKKPSSEGLVPPAEVCSVVLSFCVVVCSDCIV